MRRLLRRIGWLLPDSKESADDRPQPELPNPIDAPAFREYLPDRSASPLRPAAQKGRPAPILQPRHPSLCNRPQVSVVLGSLDRLELLKIAIASVRRELETVDGEIIVVDGGSSDGALEWLAAQPDIITIIQHNRFETEGAKMRRRSWGGFMNMAFRAAASDNVLMISDDCHLLPGALKAGLDRIEQARSAGLQVGGCAFYFRNWPEEQRYYVQRTLGGNLMVNHGIYSKQALEAVGFANEDDYVFYKADTDLSLKLWQAGHAVIDSPESICEHYVGIAEALRESNNAVMEFDRQQMRGFWPELANADSVRKMGKVELDAAPDGSVDRLWTPLRDAERRRLENAKQSGLSTGSKSKPAAKPKTKRPSKTPKSAAGEQAAKARERGQSTQSRPKRSKKTASSRNSSTSSATPSPAAGVKNASTATAGDSPPATSTSKRKTTRTRKTGGGRTPTAGTRAKANPRQT